MRLALATAVLMVTWVAPTHAGAKDLWILPNHYVRFDNGPELNSSQFRVELERMKRDGDCPDVRVRSDKNISFATVVSVMREFQRSSGCARIGFAGEEYIQDK
jgi:biopolymer transport protein ExbD